MKTQLIVKSTSTFRRDYRRALKRGLDISCLEAVIRILASNTSPPASYKDHALSGRWQGHRECHIMPDWLLIYRIDANVLVLTLSRTGTHSDLFGK